MITLLTWSTSVVLTANKGIGTAGAADTEVSRISASADTEGQGVTGTEL
jgi:hypothetical protein